MIDWKSKGLIYGSQFVAKGIERGTIELDRVAGKSAEAVLGRPSTWINVAGGLLLGFVPDFMRVGVDTKEILEVTGGHMFSKAWDYIEEGLAVAPAPTGVRVGGYSAGGGYETPSGAPEFYPPMYGQKASREPVIKNHVRYTLEG